MNLDLGQWLVIGLSAILIFGYIRGYYYNQTKAAQISSWLQAGLSKWGKVTPGERLPGMATGGRLNVLKAAHAFVRIEAVFLLEPRENLLFWLLYRLQGRRDELVLRIQLASPPTQKVIAARTGDKEFQRRLTEWKRPPFQEIALPHAMRIACFNKQSASIVVKVQDFLKKNGKSVFYLNVQPKRPQVMIRAKLPGLLLRQSEELLVAIQTMLAE